jgi:threonine synthase
VILREIGTSGPDWPLSRALREGLGAQGGLLLPRDWPRIERGEMAALLLSTREERLDHLSRLLFGADLGEEAPRVVREAIDFPLPVRELGPGIHGLELFHGPSFAFKDVGARFLARALEVVRRREGIDTELTVLTATSGDTGAAVACAFHGVAGIRAVILYPEGGVTELQERQMATLGGNVRALAVSGTFDSCQALVREAFRDPVLRADCGLTTANSLNPGRLLPQVLYSLEGVAALLEQGVIGDPFATPPVFVVPSGNFGNLTSAILGERLGLPVRSFLAATNANDTIPRHLSTGHLEPRKVVRTYSNAMDIGSPANWARIEALLGGLQGVRERVRAVRIGEEETLDAIRRVHAGAGILLDPHSAVGYAAAARTQEGVRLVYCTAHPAKFPAAVRAAISVEPELPPALAETLARSFTRKTLEPSIDALRRVLLDEKGSAS